MGAVGDRSHGWKRASGACFETSAGNHTNKYVNMRGFLVNGLVVPVVLLVEPTYVSPTHRSEDRVSLLRLELRQAFAFTTMFAPFTACLLTSHSPWLGSYPKPLPVT